MTTKRTLRNRAFLIIRRLQGMTETHRCAFLTREMKELYDRGFTEPIIAGHRLKVLFAVEDELLLAATPMPHGPIQCAQR